MNFYFTFSVVFSIFIPLVLNEYIEVNNTCNSYNISEKISLNELTGKWYELRTYGASENCSQSEFKNITSNYFTVTLSEGTNSPHIFNVSEHNETKEISIVNNNTQMSTTIKIFKIGSNPIVWTCVDLTNSSSSNQSLIILSRNKSLSAIDEIDNKLRDLDLLNNKTKLSVIHHEEEICNKQVSSANKIIISIPLLVIITFLHKMQI